MLRAGLWLALWLYCALAWAERLPEYPQRGPWQAYATPDCVVGGMAAEPSAALAECLFYFWNKSRPGNRFVSVESFNFENAANLTYGGFSLNYQYYAPDGQIFKGQIGGVDYRVYFPVCDAAAYYNSASRSCVPLPACQCDERRHANGSCQKLPATETLSWQQALLTYSKKVGSCPDSQQSFADQTENECAPDADQAPSAEVGNPLSCVSGHKIQRETDYVGPGGLSFSRSYRFDRSKGGWQSPLGQQASTLLTTANGTRVVRLTNARGSVFHAAIEANGQELPPPASVLAYRGQIGGSGSQIQRTQARLRWSFDQGKLQSQQQLGDPTSTLSYQYLANGQIEVRNAHQDRLTLIPDAQGRIRQLLTPDQQSYGYEYDAQQRLVKLVYPDSTPANAADNPYRQYLYEDPRFPQALTGIRDELGNRFATWAYDAQGRAVLSEHAGGVERLRLEYPTANSTRVIRELAPGKTHGVLYRHQLIGGRQRITAIEPDSCSGCTPGKAQWQYDANGWLDQYTNAKQRITDWDYQANGRLLQKVEGKGLSEAYRQNFSWTADGLPLEQTDSNGLKQQWRYDPAQPQRLQGYSQLAVDGSVTARTWSYRYDSQGRLSEVDGPRTEVNDLTRYEYDARHRVIRVINALNQTTQLAYDAAGRISRWTDANGVETRFSYHPRGWLSSRQLVGGPSQQFDYAANGSLTQIRWSSGQTMRYQYDAAQRLSAIQDGQGNRIVPSLDAQSRLLKTELRDAAGQLLQSQGWSYNDLDQLRQQLDSQNRVLLEQQWNEAGELSQTLDGQGKATQYQFDGLQRLIRVLDRSGAAENYAYSAQQQSLTDGVGSKTVQTHNPLGDILSESSPARGGWRWTYDAAGNRIQQTDPRGIQANYQYDALNRLLRIQWSDGQWVQYGYDQVASGQYNLGRLTSVTTANTAEQLGYNAAGQLIQRIAVRDGRRYEFGWDYNAAGQLTALRYPGGDILRYQYDANGLLQSLERFDALGGSQPLVSQLQWRPFSAQIRQLAYGNGQSRSHRWDLDGQPQQWRDGPVNRQYLGQDSRGNPKGYQDLAVAANSESWSFDLLDRLSTAQGGYGTQSFTLDAVGHRRSSGQDGQITSYQYPSLSPQLQSLQGAVTLNLGYDANGNLITYGQKALEYDASNRFVRLSEQGQWRASYVHNGLGERAIKQQPRLTTDYLYGPDGELLMEATLQGSQNRYQYLNGQPLGLHQSQPGLFNQRQALSWNLAGWQGLAQLDWNGDQQVDVLVRAGTELAVFEGQANGSVSLKRLLSGLGTDWQLAGVGDVNGDGRDDSLWRHRTSGDNAVLLAQAAGVEVVDWPKVADVGWQMRVIADFNGDGKADILWRHASQGDLAWWQLDGKRVVQALNLPRIADLSWQPQAQAAALQPGEGATLVWRQQGSGAMAAMRLNQTSYRVWDLPTVADAGWKVLRLADLNGDGQAELLWRHDNGSTFLWTDLAQGVRLGQRSLTLKLESDWTGFSHSGQTAHRLLQQQTGSGALRQLQGQTERQQYYYHNDPLGTPQALTDSWGQPVWQARYQPFGAVTLSTPLLTNNLRMPGQYFDAESGWHYNYFRTYDPSLGRYLQSDPIGLAGGVNTYAYAEGSPVNKIDPLGLMSSVDAICLRDPSFCSEIFGQMVENNGNIISRITGDDCLAEQGKSNADTIRSVGDTLTAAMLFGVAKDVAGAGLDWKAVVPKQGKYKGQNREEHVRLHNLDNVLKPNHGVFYGDGVDVTNQAWSMAKKLGIKPDSGGNLFVPMNKLTGRAGGLAADSGELFYGVHIKLIPGTNKIITSFPGN